MNAFSQVLAKFLLNATKGPDSQGTCGHIHKACLGFPCKNEAW